ncbi:MAG: hypothetical protein P1V51_15525 [Deltaproteobacteria bacterium]|nr:hypothetical protein [Deltaproteobacteria bacterium]
MEGLECQSCGARLELEADQRTGRCLYCGSPQVIERPPQEGRPNPTFVLPFEVLPAKALEEARAFVKGSFWSPGAFRRAPVEDVRGVYLPAYLYTAAFDAEYRVDIGERYTVQTRGRDGKTKTEVKTEWCSLRGRYTAWSTDEVVTASRGVPNELLESVEPFLLGKLQRYRPDLVSGWASEEPSLTPEACRELARQEVSDQAERRIAAFLPGDEQRGLEACTSVSDEHLEPLLVPVWTLPVRYPREAPEAQQKLVRLLVNGQTGKVSAKRPISWLKVSLAVLLGLAVVGGIVAAVVIGSGGM